MTILDDNNGLSDPRPVAAPERLTIERASTSEACRDGLMAVAVEAGMATVAAGMADDATQLCGGWNERVPV